MGALTDLGPVYMQVSGDPRRPNECHEFKQLPPTVEDSTPAALLMFSIGFGMASFLLKVQHDGAFKYASNCQLLSVHALLQIKAFGWAGLLCALVSLANTNSADMDAKAYMSSSS